MKAFLDAQEHATDLLVETTNVVLDGMPYDIRYALPEDEARVEESERQQREFTRLSNHLRCYTAS